MKRLKAFVVISVALLPLTLPSGCNATSQNIDLQKQSGKSEGVLQSILGDAFRVESSGKGVRVYYCPDNTCESFMANNRDALSDFVLLYLYHFSGYVYLLMEDSEGKTAIEKLSLDADKVVEKYESFCNESKVSDPICVMRKMLKKYKIKQFSLRYDEGEEHSVSYDILEEITMEKLLQTQDWRESNK